MSSGDSAAAGVEAIRWYRTPLSKRVLGELTRRSDGKGLLQAGGYLLLLGVTGTLVLLAVGRLSVAAVLALLFLHGTLYGFIGAGLHELMHGTVFRSKVLGAVFLRVYGFLSWQHNHVLYRQSHIRHHSSTLHPPEDSEVVLPIRVRLFTFLRSSVVDPVLLWHTVRDTVRLGLGKLQGDWEHVLFPASDSRARRRLFRWARLVLAGHLAIAVVGAATGLWLLPVLVTLGRFYGGWLVWLCGNTQHIGLQDNVPDFRLCCRTVGLSPVLRFLYFHMNYHAEHHMYAAVPCYNLGRLSRAIRHDMPPPARGLAGAWSEIIGILRRQEREPGYQHVYPLPGRGPSA